MGKYVLITGGELKNKGAQAMTFVTVDEIKKRYPDKEIVLLSNMDAKLPEDIKENYLFDIKSYYKRVILLQNRLFSKLYLKCKKSEKLKEFIKLLTDADAMIDVSGYAYGSNWGTTKSFHYLLTLRLANVWKIPLYVMPQSLGPFDFRGKNAFLVKLLSRTVLGKARVVMAREFEGKEGLEKNYKLKNVVLAPDLVLQNKGIDLNNIYKIIPELYEADVDCNSVAVIPNSKTVKYSSEDKAISLYKIIVDKLLEKGKRVYLVYHAVEDLSLCETIKKYYPENNDVIVIEKELSCIEFDRFVSKMDFVVASRYHSIVHSYKRSRPAVILGWSIKYAELSEKFGQKQFCFDVRDDDDVDSIISSVEYMCDNFAEESEKINNGLSAVQSENVYNYIKL